MTSIGLFYKNWGRLWRVSDCEELVGPPDRRDSKPRSPMQAEIRLTTLCIERWGPVRSFLFPQYSQLLHLNQSSILQLICELADDQDCPLKNFFSIRPSLDYTLNDLFFTP